MDFAGLKTVLTDSDSKKAAALRYVITGGIATLLQYIFYILAIFLVGLNAEIATMVSYGLSFICNFFLSNYFTFRTKPNGRKAISFTISHLVNLGCQTLFVALFKSVVGEAYALIPAMMLCIPINFFLVRFALTDKRFQSK